jgi:hypothetical protein
MWAEEFLSYGGDESLTVELNETEEEPYIRIYDGEDVQERKAEMVNDGFSVKDGPSRAVAPLIYSEIEAEEEFTDLSVETDLDSQKFKIVPFEADHENFIEKAREEALQDLETRTSSESRKEHMREKIESSDSFRARKGTFHKVKKEHGIPVISVDELAISWSPRCEMEDIDNLLARGYRPPEPPHPDVEDQIIYRESNTDRAKVSLPAKGSYFVIVEKDGETSQIPFFHREENPLKNNSYTSFEREYEKEWGILLKDDEEMPPMIYVPVHRGGKVSWTKYG